MGRNFKEFVESQEKKNKKMQQKKVDFQRKETLFSTFPNDKSNKGCQVQVDLVIEQMNGFRGTRTCPMSKFDQVNDSSTGLVIYTRDDRDESIVQLVQGCPQLHKKSVSIKRLK